MSIFPTKHTRVIGVTTRKFLRYNTLVLRRIDTYMLPCYLFPPCYDAVSRVCSRDCVDRLGNREGAERGDCWGSADFEAFLVRGERMVLRERSDSRDLPVNPDCPARRELPARLARMGQMVNRE